MSDLNQPSTNLANVIDQAFNAPDLLNHQPDFPNIVETIGSLTGALDRVAEAKERLAPRSPPGPRKR